MAVETCKSWFIQKRWQKLTNDMQKIKRFVKVAKTVRFCEGVNKAKMAHFLGQLGKAQTMIKLLFLNERRWSEYRLVS